MPPEGGMGTPGTGPCGVHAACVASVDRSPDSPPGPCATRTDVGLKGGGQQPGTWRCLFMIVGGEGGTCHSSGTFSLIADHRVPHLSGAGSATGSHKSVQVSCPPVNSETAWGGAAAQHSPSDPLMSSARSSVLPRMVCWSQKGCSHLAVSSASQAGAEGHTQQFPSEDLSPRPSHGLSPPCPRPDMAVQTTVRWLGPYLLG